VGFFEVPAARPNHERGEALPQPIRLALETLERQLPPNGRPKGDLAAEIQPIDDVRSTADYRRAVAARVLRRLIRDAGGW
jgi:CO/xanthine dehydrogenase FAD-binding subunit